MHLNKGLIVKLLEQNGWSQNELARRLGVARGTLSNALSGKRGPGRKLLSRLCYQFPGESVATFTTKERRVAV